MTNYGNKTWVVTCSKFCVVNMRTGKKGLRNSSLIETEPWFSDRN